MRLDLRKQLLIVALLVLALPLAAWQFARQVEQTLRDSHAQGLLDSAIAIAEQLGNEFPEAWPDPDQDVLYVHRAATAPWLDGHVDDWGRWLEHAQAFESEDGLLRVEFSAARYQDELYLLFQVRNPVQVFSQPGMGRGDQLELSAIADGRSGQVNLAPLAPGWLETRGQQAGGWPRAQGVWQSRGDGWALELQLPERPLPERLGFEVKDFDRSGQSDAARSAGTDGRSRVLVERQFELDRRLAQLAPAGSQAWASLPDGWIVGASDRRQTATSEVETSAAEPPSWLDTLMFERLLSGRLDVGQWRHANLARLSGPEVGRDRAATSWTTRSDDPGIVLSVSAPVRVDGRAVASVVLSRDADALLLASNRAVLRLLGVSLATLTLMGLILLGFATLLSERIRRLRDQAEQAVGPDGRVRSDFRAPSAGDELGDLGRSVAGLLGRLHEHQDYLRTLADKLAHELRTPLAMIRSSLDNLEHARDPADIARYCQRANEGSARLNRIFQAMSQAARIEDSIRTETAQPFELDQLLKSYVDACRQTYPARRFALDLPARRPVRIEGSAELFAQLLDKLIDNAVDFSQEGSEIRISLARRRQGLRLEISNSGPGLPQGAAEGLFDSMVSRRQGKSDQVHLGLGLYVARLIAEYHGASIRALDTGSGVCVRLELAAR